MNQDSNLIHTAFPNLEVTNAGSSATYLNGIQEAASAPPFLSQAVLAGELVFVSGQIAIDPLTNKMIEPGVEREAELVFNNIEAILKGVSLSLADVVKVSVYLTNFDELAKFNEIYVKRMGKCRPAREALEVSRLALGATVEVTVTAYCKGGLAR